APRIDRRHRRAWPLVDDAQTHLLHQPADPLAAHDVALAAQMPHHLPGAIERRAHVLLVHQTHQHQVELTLTRRLVVEPRPANRHQLTLASDWQRGVLAVDHLPPPIDAQRPKAFAKKSRSTTSWPIFACNFSTSASGVFTRHR